MPKGLWNLLGGDLQSSRLVYFYKGLSDDELIEKIKRRRLVSTKDDYKYCTALQQQVAANDVY